MNIRKYLTAEVYLGYDKNNKWASIGIRKFWNGRLIVFNLGKLYIKIDLCP